MQVTGIILGMLLMGFIADQIGRKWGSVLTATFMFIGGILLTASSGPTIQGWAIMFAVSQVGLFATRPITPSYLFTML
jgi:MFS family permease